VVQHDDDLTTPLCLEWHDGHPILENGKVVKPRKNKKKSGKNNNSIIVHLYTLDEKSRGINQIFPGSSQKW
jgi:hypothetical protein